LKIFIPLLFALIINLEGNSQEFTVTGEYQGKNIYMQNPLSADMINFCTQQVYLNDQLTIEHPKTSAFEINLGDLQVGDPVVIRVLYADGCIPKVINPQVIRLKSKFRFLSVNANRNEISWTTSSEYDVGEYTIERYSNKEWFIDNTIVGKGKFDTNQYSAIPNYHAGENKLRIKYKTVNDKIFYSRVFNFFSDKEPVSFYPTRVADRIMLSRATSFEVMDADGNRIVRGTSNQINCKGLKSGLYYLNIDNRTEKFYKK